MAFRFTAFILLCVLFVAPGRNPHAAEAVISLDARLSDGKAEGPRTLRARQSDIVRLAVSSDRRIVLHLHGYDLEATAAPGAPAIFEFTARATGRFPIEEHLPAGSQKGHAQAVLFLEILPR